MGSFAVDHLKMSMMVGRGKYHRYLHTPTSGTQGRPFDIHPWHFPAVFLSSCFMVQKGCFGCEWTADPILKFDLWGSGANGSLRAPVCLFRSSMLAVLMELMVCAGPDGSGATGMMANALSAAALCAVEVVVEVTVAAKSTGPIDSRRKSAG